MKTPFWVLFCTVMFGLCCATSISAAWHGDNARSVFQMVASVAWLYLLSVVVRMQIKMINCALVLFALSCLSARAQFTNGTPRVHEFIYATNDITPSTVVFIYTNSSPTLPLTNATGQVLWPLWKAVTNLNATAGGIVETPINLSLPRTYFAARASNEWGLGDFFDVIRSAPPRSDVPQRIK